MVFFFFWFFWVFVLEQIKGLPFEEFTCMSSRFHTRSIARSALRGLKHERETGEGEKVGLQPYRIDWEKQGEVEYTR